MLEEHARHLAALLSLARRRRGKGRAHLRRLDEDARRLRETYSALAEDARRESVSPAAEWLLDNFHIIAAAVRDAGVTVQETFHALPVAFSPQVIDAVERAAIDQGSSHMRLPSGAFHDAQFVVPVCPTGMIFVPCRKGISHNPAEYSEPRHLTAGTKVLAQTLAELAA